MRIIRHRSSHTRDKAVESYIGALSPDARAIVRKLTAMIRSVTPDHTELVYHGATRFCTDHIPFRRRRGRTRPI
jgi:hypothetical protein